MQNKLQFKEIASLGRTYDEYLKMFSLDENVLKDKAVLDVASGVSSFCAEANSKNLNVSATDLIYRLEANEIKNKFDKEINSIVKQLPKVFRLYNWDIYKDKEGLRKQRQKSFDLFIEDFKNNKNRYTYTCYPQTGFSDGQFDFTLVSHLLFMWDDCLSLDFHKKTILELIRVTKQEIRIFPLVNMGAEKSIHVEPLISFLQLENCSVNIEIVDYEFIKGGNQMMAIKPFQTK